MSNQFRIGQQFPINGQLYELRRACKDGKRLIFARGLGVPRYSFVVVDITTAKYWREDLRCTSKFAASGLMNYLEAKAQTRAADGVVEGLGNEQG